MRSRPSAARLVAALAVIMAAQLGVAVDALVTGGKIMPVRPKANVAKFVLNVTLAQGSPGCGPNRAVVLVNGLFQPALYANVNDTIQVTINNMLPASLPQVSSGISIHFHGFSMWDDAAWADGTAYVTQCPVAHGTSYTYSFLADEAPGTYLWHDHSAMNRANGLQGAFVLGLPKNTNIPLPATTDGDYVLFISDWFNQEANYMAMQLNRPYDNAKVTATTGSYTPVGVADAMLINGKGVASDCNLKTGNYTAKAPYFSPICKVQQFSYPAGTNGTGGCKHEVIDVERGKSYTLRLINAGTQQYVTVCFEKHKVVLLAADSTPMDSPEIDSGCVDLNTGQRYDLNFTANQPPGLYWISVHTQFASLAPSGYAVLRYVDATNTSTQLLPSTPTPQGSAVLPWDDDTQALISTSGFVLGIYDNYDFDSYWSLFRHRGSYDGVLNAMNAADQTIVFNMTSPVMTNGAVKWAMNNVAMPSSPPCECLMDAVFENSTYLKANAAGSTVKEQQASTQQLLSITTYTTSNKAKGGVLPGGVYESTAGGGSPVQPVAGMHVVEIFKDGVVDIVINNLPANSMNGDLALTNSTGTRTFSAPHPMHLHGHKFWVLGTGPGVYSPSRDYYSLNFGAPILRDTATVPSNGWMVLRFRASNPGMWPLHCHIVWHAFMGQQVVLAEAMSSLVKRSGPAAACPTSCVSNFNTYSKTFIQQAYNNSKYQLPT